MLSDRFNLIDATWCWAVWPQTQKYAARNDSGTEKIPEGLNTKAKSKFVLLLSQLCVGNRSVWLYWFRRSTLQWLNKTPNKIPLYATGIPLFTVTRLQSQSKTMSALSLFLCTQTTPNVYQCDHRVIYTRIQDLDSSHLNLCRDFYQSLHLLSVTDSFNVPQTGPEVENHKMKYWLHERRIILNLPVSLRTAGKGRRFCSWCKDLRSPATSQRRELMDIICYLRLFMKQI